MIIFFIFQAKHGEAAYPQEAWLEDQYRRHSSLPPMMRETKMDFNPNLTPNNDIDNRTGTANVAYVQTNESRDHSRGYNRRYNESGGYDGDYSGGYDGGCSSGGGDEGGGGD